MMDKNQEKTGKNKGNVNKKIKTKKKGNPEMLYRLEYLQKIAQITSEHGINSLSSVYGSSMKTLGKKCVYRM